MIARENLVSVITPVYNTAQYLPDMIDSVLAQSYGGWELLLVDDGSTDESLSICRRYAELDPRIRVFHQKNSGQAVARMTALDEARGEWVAFLDSDDVASPTYLQRMLEVAESEGADIVEGGYAEFQGVAPDFRLAGEVESIVRGRKEVVTMALDYRIKLMVFWGKLFRSNLFEGVGTAAGLAAGHYYEDEYLSPRLFAQAESYCTISDCLYGYRRRECSTMTSTYDEKHADDNRWVLNDRLDCFMGRFGDDLDGALLYRYCMAMCIAIDRARTSEDSCRLKEHVLYCRRAIRRQGKRAMVNECLSVKRKALVLLAMANPSFINFLRNAKQNLHRRSHEEATVNV